MSKRLVVVGGATAVAGLVLGASIVFGPPALKGSGKEITNRVDAPDLSGNANGGGPIGARIRGFEYEGFEVDKDGKVRGVRLIADTANVISLGVTVMTRPRAEIRLGPNRAIIITADKADMIMEGDKPRDGQFSGNVVVTLAQTPKGTDLIIDPQSAAYQRAVQQRIYLDQTTEFSLEEDRISTNGPVHVTSPQVDFYGIGLRLAYNTQRQRIEQLVISKGKYLIYNPEAESADFTRPGEVGKPEPDADPKPDTDKPKQDPPGPSQYYAVEFQGDVLVRDGVTSELAGDKLTLDFSLGTEAVSVETTPLPTGSSRLQRGLPRLLLLPGEQFAQADADTPGDTPDILPGDASPTPLPAVIIPEANRKRSLFTHDPKRDLVVTWTGRMHLKPHKQRPPQLADDKDVFVTLTGPNAYAQTTDEGETERLEFARLEYLVSEQRAVAYPRANGQARIVSDAMGGEILGKRITVRQKAGTASVLGPGELNYTNSEDGKTLNLRWARTLDLELYTRTEADKPGDLTATAALAEAGGAKETKPAGETENAPVSQAKREQSKILGLKSATFDGGVTARHTDFDLEARKLTITFDKPDKAKKIENSPNAINAIGDVVVLARGDAKDEQFDIGAERLSIFLELDKDKEPYASSISARDGVSIKRPGSTVTCKQILVELNPPSKQEAKPTGEVTAATGQTPTEKATENTDKPKPPKTIKDRFAEVRSILAVGDVIAKLDYDDRRIDLVADELLADVEKDRLTLSSKDPRKPAEVFDIAKQQKLTGETVEMDDQAERLKISGPGSLATLLKDPANPKAGIEDAFLSVAWSKGMNFDNITGKAKFVGDVRSESRRSTDASTLTCDTLDMLFSPDYKHDGGRLVDDEGKDEHDRQVRSAVAQGDVKFTAAAWEHGKPDKITNRTLLFGPKLVFTNKPAKAVGQTPIETLVVEGEGKMLLEDYREKKEKKDDKQAKAPAPGQPPAKDESVDMTGRGKTAFTWQEKMTLDARSNTAKMSKDVMMIHRALDDQGGFGEPVQLDCQKLVADMIDTGGLSVWLSDDAPDARVTQITADGAVRLLQNGLRSMSGDHLKYEAQQDLAWLWSDNNQPVIIRDLKRGSTTKAMKATLDLNTNRVELTDIQGGSETLD